MYRICSLRPFFIYFGGVSLGRLLKIYLIDKHMYDFVFWFFYKFFEWRKGFQSSFIASMMVCFTMIVHIALLYSFIRYIGGISIGVLDGSYRQRRLILLPIVMLFSFLVWVIYYGSRALDILEKNSSKKISSGLSILMIIIILVVPLLVAIILTNLAEKI
ncbi:MAG: hypothetical protein QM731_03935 [Chitinophagaceae bacterium]